MTTKWEDDSIQFPRLIAEIAATQEYIDFGLLADAMGITEEDVSDLFERAHKEWERRKKDTK